MTMYSRMWMWMNYVLTFQAVFNWSAKQWFFFFLNHHMSAAAAHLCYAYPSSWAGRTGLAEWLSDTADGRWTVYHLQPELSGRYTWQPLAARQPIYRTCRQINKPSHTYCKLTGHINTSMCNYSAVQCCNRMCFLSSCPSIQSVEALPATVSWGSFVLGCAELSSGPPACSLSLLRSTPGLLPIRRTNRDQNVFSVLALLALVKM